MTAVSRFFVSKFERYKFTAKEYDEETGLYYYGARYYDAKLSRWCSADPPLSRGDYLPVPPVNDKAKERNGNLPGMGGVFNSINLDAYHYAGDNPVKITDPDGNWIWVVAVIVGIIIDEALDPSGNIATYEEEMQCYNTKQSDLETIEKATSKKTVEKGIDVGTEKIPNKITDKKIDKIGDKYKQNTFRHPNGDYSNEGTKLAKKRMLAEVEDAAIKGKTLNKIGRLTRGPLKWAFKAALFFYNDYSRGKEYSDYLEKVHNSKNNSKDKNK